MTQNSAPDMRSTWQDQMMARNFPDGAQGPFLSPRTTDNDPLLAQEALQRTTQGSHDAALVGRLATGGGLDILRQSPNWNQLASGLAPSVPLAEDPHVQAWSTDRTAQVETRYEKVRELYTEVLEELRYGVEEGINEGYLSPVMADRLEDAFAHTAVQMVDQAAFMPGELGNYAAEEDRVELSSVISGYDEKTAVLIAHELLGHKASGGTFHLEGDGSIGRSRIGFAEVGANKLLDEAVQQHIILSCLYGDFAIVDPDKRSDGDLLYYEGRKVFAAFVDRSNELIDLRPVTRGSSEDTDDMRTETTDRRIMQKQARTTYGPGAYRKLGKLLQVADAIAPAALDAHEQLQAVIDRIHGPTVAPDGSLVPGYIDV